MVTQAQGQSVFFQALTPVTIRTIIVEASWKVEQITKSTKPLKFVARHMKRAPTNFYLSLSPYPRADTTRMSLDSTRDSSYAQIPRPRVEGQSSSLSENRGTTQSTLTRVSSGSPALRNGWTDAEWRLQREDLCPTARVQQPAGATGRQQQQQRRGQRRMKLICKILSGRFKRWMKGERES